MKNFVPLTTRRQLLLSGLAMALLPAARALAKTEPASANACGASRGR